MEEAGGKAKSDSMGSPGERITKRLRFMAETKGPRKSRLDPYKDIN